MEFVLSFKLNNKTSDSSEFKNELVITKKLTSIFDETIINIKSNLNDTSYYSLNSGHEFFENIF
jgi:hypothetical protein